jgi:hypothetical protein
MIIAATQSVLKETSEIRQLSILRPVKSGAQSRGEIERMIIKNLDEDLTPAEFHAAEITLKKFGLVPSDFQYRPFLVKLLTEQVAGYYDPRVQEFYLADWIELDGQMPVMAHELTHALQDQHFNLRRFEKWPKGDSDAELAAHALIEGDATVAMIQYVARDIARIKALTSSVASGGSANEQIDHAPRALRDTLLFPYLQGSTWATLLFTKGGWSLVSMAFTDLPQSTEQILHSEKYYSREAPIRIALPDVSRLLGSGWRRIDSDVNGEWGYFLILDEYLKSETESKRATEGWGGDRLNVYEGRKPGQQMIVHVSVWDTDRDAREFFDAYAKRTELRYKDAIAIKESPASAGLRREWKTSEGIVAIEIRQRRVQVVEGLSGATKVTALMKALSR